MARDLMQHTMKITVKINRFIPSGLFYLNSMDRSISNLRGLCSVLIVTMFY